MEETASRLQDFVRNLSTSHPDFFSQVVYDIWASSEFNLAAQPRETLPFKVTDLVYKTAQILHDGRLYEGTWNEQTDEIEGLGVLIASDGSLLEGFF